MIHQEQPTSLRTDRFEVRIYWQKRMVKFHGLRIRHQEILACEDSKLTLTAQDFARFPDALDGLIEILTEMRGKKK